MDEKCYRPLYVTLKYIGAFLPKISLSYQYLFLYEIIVIIRTDIELTLKSLWGVWYSLPEHGSYSRMLGPFGLAGPLQTTNNKICQCQSLQGRNYYTVACILHNTVSTIGLVDDINATKDKDIISMHEACKHTTGQSPKKCSAWSQNCRKLYNADLCGEI